MFAEVSLKSLPIGPDGFSTSPTSATARISRLFCRGHPTPTIRIAAMLRRSASTEKSFGYLTTVETAEFGYFGGYLIVSSLGRPLEFHCTAPIQPSRAQRILYGPTLASYLLGEQICGALSGAAKLTPELILTDCEVALHARNRFAVPIALVTAVEQVKSVDGLNQAAHGASGVLFMLPRRPSNTSSVYLRLA